MCLNLLRPIFIPNLDYIFLFLLPQPVANFPSEVTLTYPPESVAPVSTLYSAEFSLRQRNSFSDFIYLHDGRRVAAMNNEDAGSILVATITSV